MILLALLVAAPADAEEPLEGSASIEARASVQGEETARLVALAQIGAVSIRGGAESTAGPQAPLRHAAIIGAGVRADGWEAEAEARVAPPQAGAEGLTGELTGRHDFDGAAASLGVAALQSAWSQCAICEAQVLSGFGAIGEAEVDLPFSFRAGLRAAAFSLQLREPAQAGPASRSSRGKITSAEFQQGPWDRFGASTLSWPQRWDASAQAQRSFGPIAVTLNGGVGAPPADGVIATHGLLKLEGTFGLWTATMAGSVAHLTPTGQVLAELSISVAVRFGGVP